MSIPLIASYAVAILIDIGFPPVLAVIVWKRYRVSWKFFAFGALIFFVFQLITRVPAVIALQTVFTKQLQASRPLLIGWMALAAFTAGLFEDGGRWLGYRFLWQREEKTWEKGLMYGIGHGGLESMLFVGGLAIVSMVTAMVLPTLDVSELPVPSEQAEAIRAAQEQFATLPWWLPLLGGVERIFAMAVQVSLSIMVLQCFLRRNNGWLWVAIGYHTLVDFVAPLLNHFIGASAGHLGTLGVEAVVGLFALFSLWVIFHLRGARPIELAAEPSAEGVEAQLGKGG